MVPKDLVIFTVENCVKLLQDSGCSCIRSREEGSDKRCRCPFKCTEEGVEDAQTRLEEVAVKARKGITQDLLV